MKILLIEDDAGIGRFVSNGLRANGFDVDWLRVAEPALRRLQATSYSAIVLDLMLPDADGFDYCRQLREIGISTPICMLTARDSLDDKLEGFRAGADDYVVKPFVIDELVARLKAMMRRDANASAGNRITVGPLAIDLLAREAKMEGLTLDLTRREFDVLVFFAQNAGQAITRERLLQTAWGTDGDVTPNTVDVYVGYLRRKLKAAGDTPTIVTIRGIGFKLA
ncbi:MAG: response regulator transcription factor [Hyphomicrobium sp.]